MEINEEKTNNAVFLRGRVSQPPIERDLPSGDTIVSFRLIVDRPPGERGVIDTIECAALRPRVRRTVSRAGPGDVLEVEGRLHRRFWRGGPGGTSSRCEVRVEAVRLISSDRRSGASRVRTPASA
jgi:single-strand DNA-binding protein